jgi:hypothetical protein
VTIQAARVPRQKRDAQKPRPIRAAWFGSIVAGSMHKVNQYLNKFKALIDFFKQ